jgi:LCP family protein required for cell wall assembly
MTRFKKIILAILGAIFVIGGIIFLKGANTLSVISSGNPDSLFSPGRDERWDILILGDRGVNEPSGGMLTDSIMVLSYKKETGQAALFSIPRDLYVSIPDYGYKKINCTYVIGEMREPGEGGLKLAKEVIGEVTGLELDFAVIVDVYALKEIVDTLGGIEIEEDKYFSTYFYKNYVTIYPGKNCLSGSETLAYVGSRAIGSDFGRMRRQQKVMVALKDKIWSLGLLARPDKIWNILNSLEKHIKTDIPLSQMKDLIDILPSLEIGNIDQVVFDISNYLYSTHTDDGAYILLPKAGDFLEIQEKCQGIFIEVEAD